MCVGLLEATQASVGHKTGKGWSLLLLFMPLYSADKVLLFLVLESWGRCKAQGKVTEGACNCISEKMMCNICSMTLK